MPLAPSGGSLGFSVSQLQNLQAIILLPRRNYNHPNVNIRATFVATLQLVLLRRLCPLIVYSQSCLPFVRKYPQYIR